MAASKTSDVRLNTNRTFGSALSRGAGFDTGTIALDSSYPTGGETLAFFNNTTLVMCQPRGGYVFDYDITNSKLKALLVASQPIAAQSTEMSVLVEASNTKDLSALSDIPFVAFGWD